jgi:dimethylhistidine N-methyltransferase
MTSAPPAPRFLSSDAVAADPRAELAAGLRRYPQAALSPKFFYDRLGSALFVAITELEEYTPTRDEAAILARHGAEIAAAVHARLGPRPMLVDLGAGDCAKAAGLFPQLRPARYVAVDIAVDFLRDALAALQQRHPDVEMWGLAQDFSARLALPAELAGGPALVFYPGSSIGNFEPGAALRLLRDAHAAAAGGALLIGVDLVRAPDVLKAAYDDALGVTAAFNRNLLRHANRLLGSDFDPRQWAHESSWDAAGSRVQMWLRAREPLVVRWPGGERGFAAGERIHTEDAHKWTPGSFGALLRDAGWTGLRHWCDDARRFAVFLAAA